MIAVGCRSAGGQRRDLVGAAPEEDCAPGGDAHGDTDLAEGVVDPGRHPAALLRHHAHGHVGDHGVEQADADARDQEARQQRRPARARAESGHEQQPGASSAESDRHHHARIYTREQCDGQRRHEERRQRDRQVAQPSLEGRVAEVVLQVEREIEEEREQRCRDREGRELNAGERAPAEQPERQHRLSHALLDRRERREHDRRAGKQTEDQRASPALVVAAQERQHEHQQPAAEARQPKPVHARGVRIARLAQLRERGRDHGDADRHIDEEDPAPAEAVGDRTSHQRAHGDGHADRGAVDAHRRSALPTGWELLRNQREGDREHRGGADALHGTRDVQEGGIRREPGGQRGGREDPKPRGEHAAAPQAVGERAGGEHHGGERERVSVDHPLQVGEVGRQVLLDRGEGRVHDRDVQQEHEGGHAHRNQGPPLPSHHIPPLG